MTWSAGVSARPDVQTICLNLRRAKSYHILINLALPPRSSGHRGAHRHPQMTPLPRNVIAAIQYQELMQCCHELFHIALGANALSRRDARWYQSQLHTCWDESWQTWDEYLASAAECYG